MSFFYFLEAGFCSVIPTGFELTRSFLYQPPGCWDYRTMLSFLESFLFHFLKVLFYGARALSSSVGKQTLNGQGFLPCNVNERGTGDSLRGKSLSPSEAVLKTECMERGMNVVPRWQCRLTTRCHVYLMMLGLASGVSRGQEPGWEPGSGPEERGGLHGHCGL